MRDGEAGRTRRRQGGGCNSLVTVATVAELQVMLITPIRLL